MSTIRNHSGDEKKRFANRVRFGIEFLTDTQGQVMHSKKVISDDYVELGRDVSCAIRFDESFVMVSRRHAAIARENGQIVLLHLSSTNQTLINGRPVHKEWVLHNGDEIQLAADGPRVRFYTVADKVSMKLTDRIKVFSEKSLKPYRYALLGLGALFVVTAIVAVFFIRKTMNEKETLAALSQSIEKQLAEQQRALARGDSALVAERAQKADELAEANKKSEQFQSELAALGHKITVLTARKPTPQPSAKGTSVAPAADVSKTLGDVRNYLYSLQLYLTIKDANGEFMELSNNNQQKIVVNNIPLDEKGTGFVLEDGRFVTARRWVEPWVYVRGEDDYLNLFANFIHHNGGRASVKIVATGPNGQQVVFQTHLFTTDLLKDQISVGDFGFGKGKITIADLESATDWAVFKGMAAKGLPFSDTMAGVEEIHTLGFLANSGKSALYGKGTLSAETSESTLLLLNQTSGATNMYGAPAVAMINNRPTVVGLITSQKDGKPAVIPISELK